MSKSRAKGKSLEKSMMKMAILFLAPFDMILYRPIITWARLKGSWGFLRGNKAWNKFERNVRAPA